ncbi:hypothetical protein NHQ30_006278 [Ciborinia camelliae]|nr:hypothetical protein NHQ30_006278 [Ciborinia camelliae]
MPLLYNTMTRSPSFIAIFIAFLSFACFTFAQTSTPSATSTSSTATAAIVPSSSSYTYLGCYNETSNTNSTGGLRALHGGVTEALDVMTVPLCLSLSPPALTFPHK